MSPDLYVAGVDVIRGRVLSPWPFQDDAVIVVCNNTSENFVTERRMGMQTFFSGTMFYAKGKDATTKNRSKML